MGQVLFPTPAQGHILSGPSAHVRRDRGWIGLGSFEKSEAASFTVLMEEAPQ